MVSAIGMFSLRHSSLLAPFVLLAILGVGVALGSLVIERHGVLLLPDEFGFDDVFGRRRLFSKEAVTLVLLTSVGPRSGPWKPYVFFLDAHGNALFAVVARGWSSRDVQRVISDLAVAVEGTFEVHVTRAQLRSRYPQLLSVRNFSQLRATSLTGAFAFLISLVGLRTIVPDHAIGALLAAFVVTAAISSATYRWSGHALGSTHDPRHDAHDRHRGQ
jgi:hypothetical protein